MGGKRRLLVAFVDALGPAQVARFGDRLGFLPYRGELEGVLGYSSGALPTILTGAHPEGHGRMCLFSARPPEQTAILRPLRWLGLLPRVVHERQAVRRRLAGLLARAGGLTGYVALHRVPPEAFDWLDLPEREDMFRASDVGGARTFLADAREAGVGVYAAPWQLPEAERWQDAHRALEADPPDLAFLYCAELDGALHRGGTAGAEAEQAMDRIAGHLERAREQMARGGAEVTTLVVGDHGMADVHEAVDPRDVTRRLDGQRLFVDSTMLRLWGDGAQLDQARRVIDRAGWPGRWLDEDGLRARRAPVDGYPYGRAAFLLDEGAIFAPSWVGGRVAGMHGYDVQSQSARAAVLSDAPLPAGCRSLVDVAPLVRRELGLQA